MTIIRRTSPRSELMSFRDAVDRLFDDAAFRPLAWGGSEARLPLDITSTEDAITVEAALPGIQPEDVEITVHQDNLTIGVKEQAERQTQEGERVYRELRRSSGSRTLTLPSGLDTEHAIGQLRERHAAAEHPACRGRQAPPDPSDHGHGGAIAVAAGSGQSTDEAAQESAEQA